MTWLVHATNILTTGQLAWAIFFVLTGAAMTVDTIWRHTRARKRRRRASPVLYDWARNDPGLRQAVNVHRRAS